MEPIQMTADLTTILSVNQLAKLFNRFNTYNDLDRYHSVLPQRETEETFAAYLLRTEISAPEGDSCVLVWDLPEREYLKREFSNQVALGLNALFNDQARLIGWSLKYGDYELCSLLFFEDKPETLDILLEIEGWESIAGRIPRFTPQDIQNLPGGREVDWEGWLAWKAPSGSISVVVYPKVYVLSKTFRVLGVLESRGADGKRVLYE